MQTSLFTYQHLYSYELKSFLQRLYTEITEPSSKALLSNPTQTNQNTYSGLLTTILSFFNGGGPFTRQVLPFFNIATRFDYFYSLFL